jgi:hypothetical protein
VTIQAYIEEVKETLLTHPHVVALQIVRERVTATDCHLRARLLFLDSSHLEFSEYAQRQPDGSVGVVTYSYNWTNSSHELIRRWDNTPHHPRLAGFPHHVHDGRAKDVLPGQPTNILAVLDIITGRETG